MVPVFGALLGTLFPLLGAVTVAGVAPCTVGSGTDTAVAGASVGPGGVAGPGVGGGVGADAGADVGSGAAGPDPDVGPVPGPGVVACVGA